MEDKIQKLQEIIDNAKHIVFFTGAGVSTDSGIPDFRSQDGLYNQQYRYPPETIISHSFFMADPEEFYRFYKDKMLYLDAEPNFTHILMAELEKKGKSLGVVTQNIDGLHQKAGSKRVYELHGSVLRNYCLNCHAKYDLDFMLQFRDTEDHVPHCLDCGGVVRPDVVLYEESLNSRVLYESEKVISEADVMIVGGTSLVVYPAAGLLHYFSGSKLVLINKSATSFDSRADLVIHDSVGKALKYAVS